MIENVFFAPGLVYLQGDPLCPAEYAAQFSCKWVGKSLVDGGTLATGFARDGSNGRWELAALGTDVWKAGWFVAPNQGAYPR